jgi:hypothetical protein
MQSGVLGSPLVIRRDYGFNQLGLRSNPGSESCSERDALDLKRGIYYYKSSVQSSSDGWASSDTPYWMRMLPNDIARENVD